MDDALAARGAMALIHHPTALEIGYSEDDRARLRGIEARLLQHLARVIVTSEPTSEQLRTEFSVARARLAVVIPGTDDLPRSNGFSGTTCQILSIGTLIPRKGHGILLRALARLFDLDWHLTIVGAPSRKSGHARALVELAAELGLMHRVRFVGEVSDDALAVLWRSTDLFALASYREGYGMAIAEALKRGVPVAVTAVGIVPTLVTAENGIVVQPGDQELLSKALRRVVFDSDLRRAMAQSAWETGRTLPSWDEQSQAFADALLSKD
jgi:glycosyltransferase involved in cell wall biosynthesis